MPNYYAVLDVAPDVDSEALKASYRSLARRYHPDHNPGDAAAEERFKELTEAFTVLSTPSRRAAYDKRHGFASSAASSAAPTVSGASPAATPRARTPSVRSGTRVNPGPSPSAAANPRARRRVVPSVADLLGDFFATEPEGGHGTAGIFGAMPPIDGGDVVQSIELDFETSAFGGSVTTTVFRSCACPECGGRGRIERGARCSQCRGTSTVKTSEVLRAVRVEPGARPGSILRVPGKGEAGRFGGKAGDLVLSVRVKPHARFAWEGSAVVVVVPVTIAEAVFGATIDVPTLTTSKATIRIPPGVRSGQRIRLEGPGIRSREGAPADLLVELRLELPPVLDEESRRLIEAFDARNPFDPRRDLGAAEQTPERGATCREANSGRRESSGA